MHLQLRTSYRLGYNEYCIISSFHLTLNCLNIRGAYEVFHFILYNEMQKILQDATSNSVAVHSVGWSSRDYSNVKTGRHQLLAAYWGQAHYCHTNSTFMQFHIARFYCLPIAGWTNPEHSKSIITIFKHITDMGNKQNSFSQ